ncbi:Peroxidase [Mycena sanguinolenta]|uniref:Peroxidase n=1 Tax=Mycena sanguinolenta TaxID=230812 RepID=A0A8H7DDA1_9AGAR|nr:Peroxidase [Mycena sanguinolenta]
MLVIVFFACLGTANAYIWPSPQLDALEALRFDLDRNGLTSFLDPCDQFAFDNPGSGRSNAADWIRTAYHDMATYNITDGTGGMDASIRFSVEQARPEDPGDGFLNSNIVLGLSANRYISIADTLAVGAILAIEACGGPQIAFRGGRVDAGEPNLPGVPEPQQDLASHVAAFARQGFNQTEMIGLVACGHTFGGVQQSLFPLTVPEFNAPNNSESVAHFDSTFVTFDNNIATEYISGTTLNPLVVGNNETTNSDKRIFGSDGNATMLAFANSPEHFAATCADLFARMVDTVPNGVQLTEVIEPLPVKPANIKIDLDGDNIRFAGEVRFWNLPDNPERTVNLLWDDRVGGKNNATLLLEGVSDLNGRNNATWYAFNASADTGFLTLNATAGITNMQFVVDDTLENQGALFVLTGRWDVAVRSEVNATLTRLYLEQDSFDSVNRPIVVEVDLTPNIDNAVPGFAIWSGPAVNAAALCTISAEIGGVTVSRSEPRSLLDFSEC